MTDTCAPTAIARLESSIQSALARYWPHFVSCVLIFVALYFSEFSEYLLRIDEEFAVQRQAGLFWVPYGRWGTSVIEALMLRPLNPYFSMLIFGCFVAASFLVFCKVIRVTFGRSILASFVIFAGFPTWYYIIEFKGTLVANGISVFLATVAGALFVSRQRFANLLFVLVLTSAVSIYQSSIFVTLTVSTEVS